MNQWNLKQPIATYILPYKRMDCGRIFRGLMRQSKVADGARQREEEQLAIKMYLMESAAQAILDGIPSEDTKSWLPLQMNRLQKADEGESKEFQAADKKKSWEHHLFDEIYNNHWEKVLNEDDESHQKESELESLSYKTEQQPQLIENMPQLSLFLKTAGQQGSKKHLSIKQSPSQPPWDCIQMPNQLKRVQSDSFLQSDITFSDLIKTRKFRKMQ